MALEEINADAMAIGLSYCLDFLATMIVAPHEEALQEQEEEEESAEDKFRWNKFCALAFLVVCLLHERSISKLFCAFARKEMQQVNSRCMQCCPQDVHSALCLEHERSTF